ncbi:hypothetical protein [Spiroplasma endosymbiont of Megaselia nigra]|uniref:hypothetical protein n=1 Tax=Spiroplasma endosymbiont of Megaselia nigra TaxID=2478537 RepID=UPI000F86617C|nr:hypothetical protein [Spiroplasma endosymbiont of Megaselia nigra]RUO86108.1 hypothetical protein D9R21_04985 [Spiroplasma endosymbiont of Megaselia nigra]
MINDNVEYIILLQLDAINIKGYTGQAVLHLGVKVKPVVASGVININGVVDLNGGIVGKYERTDFTKHFNSLLKLYDNSMVFTIDAWQAYLPALGTRIEISQAQKNNLASVLNKQYRPKLEVTNIYQNGDVKHLKISWKFVDLKNNEKIINIMPYVHKQAFDQFHLQGNFKYNLKISYTSKTN